MKMGKKSKTPGHWKQRYSFWVTPGNRKRLLSFMKATDLSFDWFIYYALKYIDKEYILWLVKEKRAIELYRKNKITLGELRKVQEGHIQFLRLNKDKMLIGSGLTDRIGPSN